MTMPTKPQKPRLTDRNRKKPNLLKSITKNEAQKENAYVLQKAMPNRWRSLASRISHTPIYPLRNEVVTHWSHQFV